ncbi:MAG: hypothetical protein HY852_08405 [Bradyrhizobium sp.]|uniref:hypothetical protein n=1 Tax=Bradyrhizobium sp. TaxID=376 RepID=UPI0025C160FD|nr:hypothetical protein [Bradyrhizobium sp.]MBI5261820.1 hypothetical protein [Bradyrhizobium sp.]
MSKVVAAFCGISLLLAVSAHAAPLNQGQSALAPAPLAEQVKVICDEAGQCYRPPKRRLTARWVYGDGNFYGPYTEPGYYGNPRLRYRLLPYWWW